MVATVLVGFAHQGRQLHPGDRVWLPLGAFNALQRDGKVRPAAVVQHRDPQVVS